MSTTLPRYWLMELRTGVKRLQKEPGFACAVALILALATDVVTAVRPASRDCGELQPYED